MPSRCLVIVAASLTKDSRRLRRARLMNRWIRIAKTSWLRLWAKIARNASVSVKAAPDLAAGGPEPFERGGLALGEVVRALEQRPACALEAPGGVGVAEVAQLVPVAAADLVERFGAGLGDVERVDRDHGLWGVGAGALGIAGSHVEADRLDPLAALLAERSEEQVRGPRVVAFGAPHDPRSAVIGHEGEVAVLGGPTRPRRSRCRMSSSRPSG